MGIVQFEGCVVMWNVKKIQFKIDVLRHVVFEKVMKSNGVELPSVISCRDVDLVPGF